MRAMAVLVGLRASVEGTRGVINILRVCLDRGGAAVEVGAACC